MKLHKWFHSSQEWAKKNKNNKYSFQSLCETCWYSMCKVYMSIAYYQTNVQGTLDKYPKTPSPLMQFRNVEHLMMNDYMHELVTLVADLIGYLEKAETNLAYITVQVLLYRSTLITWKQSATSATSSLMLPLVLYPNSTKEYFLRPVYVIAMYLSPKCCHLAISKSFTHDYLKPEILKLTMNWKFKKDECIQLAQDIHHKYDLFSFTKDHKTMTPMSFWKIAQQFTKPTRKLASFVFQLKGHAVLRFSVIILFLIFGFEHDNDENK